MDYSFLGKSNLNVSRVSFGCMSLGDDHAENARILHHARDQGINFFDTADLYQKGFNEETVGRAFRDTRHRVLIATKAGNQWRSDGSGWDWNPSKNYILKAAEESLRRLQTDHIDLYQLHGGTTDDPIDETIEAFEILKREGKIRYYGISSIRPNVIREYVKRSNITSVMMQYSLLDRRPEEQCLPLLQQHRIGVLTRGSLAGGLLIDKPAKPYLTYKADDVAKAAKAISDMTGIKRSKTEAALQFVLHHPAVTTAVAGVRTWEQLEECIRVADGRPLTDDEAEKLKGVIEPNLYVDHR
jgi:aryl-alcohol dehydrogenase-like predicted oxidoreductase